MFKNSLRSWLTFYRGEHTGAVFVLIIAAIFALLPRIYNAMQPAAKIQFYEDSIAASKATYNYSRSTFQTHSKPFKKGWINLHYSTAEYLESKGFEAKTAKAIVEKYKSSSFFKSATEMAIFCKMDSSRILRLINPISFQASGFQQKPPAYKEAEPEIVDLNASDSIQIASLPGIGMKTAAKIYKYGARLGGFYTFNQLKEIWYIDTNIIERIRPYVRIDASKLHKINIATATEEELSQHPYCSKKQAKLIIAYRKQHKVITEVAFDQIPAFTAEQKSKLKNYLLF